jgi:hypothetical protein
MIDPGSPVPVTGKKFVGRVTAGPTGISRSILPLGILVPVFVFPEISVSVIIIGHTLGIGLGMILNVPLPVTVPVPIIAPVEL